MQRIRKHWLRASPIGATAPRTLVLRGNSAVEMYQHDCPSDFQFVLSGDLSGEAVQQLRWAWQTAKSTLGARDLLVDISGIANADPCGLELLFRMRKAGARLIADLPPVSLELLRQFGVPALPPRSGSGLLARIWRRSVNPGPYVGRAAKKSEVM